MTSGSRVALAAVGARLRQAWLRVESLAETRSGLVACFAAALVVYGLGSLAWPLAPGRDSSNYIDYYLDMWNGHPAYPALMLVRTPLAPLFFGPLLQLGGGVLAEVATACLYALSLTAWTAAASICGRRCAAVTAVALLLYMPYVAIFHQVSSDSVFAAAFALWAFAAIRAASSPSLARFALAGVLYVAAVLARPGAQPLIAFAVVPLLTPAAPWRQRALRSGAFLAVAVVGLAGWAGYNDLRYADFTVARGAGAAVPFYRVCALDHLIKPENGVASRELADAVRRDLLTTQLYRTYGVTSSAFFATESGRECDDLVGLSDRAFGWNSNYSILRRAAIEAIRRHPGIYASGVIDSVKFTLRAAYVPPTARRQHRRSRAAQTVVVRGRRLPTSQDEPIPYSYMPKEASSPDNHIVATANGPKWTNPGGQAHAAWLQRASLRLESDLPNRDGSPTVARILNFLARIYPRMLLVIVLALLAIVIRRPRGIAPLLAIAVLGAVVVFTTLLGQPPALEYRVPIDPAVILLAVASLTARSGRSKPRFE